MEYDHSYKVGNEGDVVKHASLCRLVERILDQTSGGSFIYAESHTGRAAYVLRDKGRWIHGIKIFSENLLEFDSENEAVLSRVRFKSLNAYREACFPQNAQVGSAYYGSSGMVRKMLSDANLVFQFWLWDSNPDVVKALAETYRDASNISVFQGDGYMGLQSLENATLALIDPISVIGDESSIMSTMSHLQGRGIPFLCWVPLCGRDVTVFDEFENKVKNSYATVRVTWQIREGSTWGCQVTVPRRFGTILEETCRDVCEVMNLKPWTLHPG